MDLLTETSPFLAYVSSPRVGHLNQALHLFIYLNDHKWSKYLFDPNYVDITDNHMPDKRRENYRSNIMKELYPEAMEDFPLNAPKPKGQDVQISCFVDAYHGGYQITQISRTVIFIFLDKVPIMWYLNRENTVDFSLQRIKL